MTYPLVATTFVVENAVNFIMRFKFKERTRLATRRILDQIVQTDGV
jgi:hypothetical protein